MLRSVDEGLLSDVVPVVSILTEEVWFLIVVVSVRQLDATGGVVAVEGAGGVVVAGVACKADRCGGARRIAGC